MFKNKIFIFFFIFYIYLVINILLSEITEKVFLNIIFYIRFIVFSFAIAVAPVTNWRFYDTIYTERFMRTPQENPEGYDLNSPINYADQLKGDFLIIHGSGDDNVHVQNTMRMVEALIQADKQFEWLIYPDKNHGISGGNTRKHLYTKMTNFIFKNL